MARPTERQRTAPESGVRVCGRSAVSCESGCPDFGVRFSTCNYRPLPWQSQARMLILIPRRFPETIHRFDRLHRFFIRVHPWLLLLILGALELIRELLWMCSYCRNRALPMSPRTNGRGVLHTPKYLACAARPYLQWSDEIAEPALDEVKRLSQVGLLAMTDSSRVEFLNPGRCPSVSVGGCFSDSAFLVSWCLGGEHSGFRVPNGESAVLGQWLFSSCRVWLRHLPPKPIVSAT